MEDDRELDQARVPVSAVLLSMVGLWTCYSVLATLRGWVIGLGYQDELLSRRLVVAMAGVAVTILLWLLLRKFDNARLGSRIAVALIASLPASLILAAVNDAVFSDIEERAAKDMEKKGGTRIQVDDAGNVLIDVPGVGSINAAAPKPPASPQAPPPPEPPMPPSAMVTPDIPDIPPEPDEPAAEPPEPPASGNSEKGGAVTIETESPGQVLWKQLTDVALSRYFLLLAWSALYFAMVQAQTARMAERREGEYRRAAKAAELRSLRYQVNPHFLFNTLNSLSALVLTGRTDRAEAMIQTISTFYRRSLTGDPSGDVPLSEEIELQRLYLEIETVRFPDRLRTRIDIPVDLFQAQIPGMILQPLIENSVKYAVAPSKLPVTINLVARVEDGQLVLTVEDDGTGEGISFSAKGFGIGLANVRDRLAARFGNRASFSSAGTGSGWRSVIRMPLETAGQRLGGDYGG
jgi:two-component system LytT family sensor kinase